jgi:transposase-like protein
MTLPPVQHCTKLRSTDPLERLNKEDRRRADVVGIFRNEARITRLIGAVLVEQSDEWLPVLTLRHMRHGGRRHHRLAKEERGAPPLACSDKTLVTPAGGSSTRTPKRQ